MTFQLPELPFDKKELEPFISEQTLNFHYNKHHKTYVDKLNTLIKDTPFANKMLEEIIKSSSGPTFNNAAQVWNHTFYWHCLTGDKSQKPTTKLLDLIIASFGSMDDFEQQFKNSAATNFGSGWTWLVITPLKKLEIVNTSNANCPLTTTNIPLLTCDVWEHAYYIDTQNNRAQYLDNFFKIINWDFVSANLNQVV
jgi:superoxide dismutase, Fe-Mn family